MLAMKGTAAEVAAQFGISERTYRRYKRRDERAPLKPCGTNAAYQRHLRHGEVADQACLDAHALEARQSASYLRRRLLS